MGLFIAVKLLKFALISLSVSIFFLLCNIIFLLRLSKIKKKMVESFEIMSNLQEEDFIDGLFSLEMLKTVIKQIRIDVFKKVTVGSKITDYDDLMVAKLLTNAEHKSTDFNKKVMILTENSKVDSKNNLNDPSVVSIEKTESKEGSSDSCANFVDLRKLCSKEIPLVLNFGSCS